MFVIGVPPNDLPAGWEIAPDPELAGANIAHCTAANGRLVVLVMAMTEPGRPEVSLVYPAMLTPGEIDGENRGDFLNFDLALQAANKILERVADEHPA